MRHTSLAASSEISMPLKPIRAIILTALLTVVGTAWHPSALAANSASASLSNIVFQFTDLDVNDAYAPTLLTGGRGGSINVAGYYWGVGNIDVKTSFTGFPSLISSVTGQNGLGQAMGSMHFTADGGEMSAYAQGETEGWGYESHSSYSPAAPDVPIELLPRTALTITATGATWAELDLACRLDIFDGTCSMTRVFSRLMLSETSLTSCTPCTIVRDEVGIEARPYKDDEHYSFNESALLSVTFENRTDRSKFVSASLQVNAFVFNGGLIPEPSTFAMMLGGLGLLLVAARRRSTPT